METFTPRGNIHGPILPQFIMDTPITLGAKIMYALLCNYASDSDHCWPSHATLAAKLSCSVTSVKKYLAELTVVKLISVRREQYRSSVYYMMRPDALNDRPEKTVQSEPVAACPQPIIDHTQAEIGYLNTLSKQEEITPPPPLPPVPVPRSLPPTSGPVGGGGFSFQDFEKAWEAYPKKEAKGLAWNAWKQLLRNGQLPSVSDLLAAFKRFSFKESWQRENGRYIPQLSNFLRGQRWLDPLSPEEEQAVQQRQEVERMALASKREQEAVETRNTEKRQRLRPIYDAFTEKFGEEAQQFHEGTAAMSFGTWMFLHEKYGGPTAADVPDGNSLTILDFMKAYQRRRDEEAYREARVARDSQAANREQKPTNTSSARTQRSEVLALLLAAPTPICAAA